MVGVKATFTLNDSLIAQARAIQKEEIDCAIRKAADDPLFIADMSETEACFAHVDWEGAVD